MLDRPFSTVMPPGDPRAEPYACVCCKIPYRNEALITTISPLLTPQSRRIPPRPRDSWCPIPPL